MYRGGAATASFHDTQNNTKKPSQLQSEQSTPIFPSLESFRGEKEIYLLDF